MANCRPNEVRPEAITDANVKDCHLLFESDRTFYVKSMKKGWPGISSAFYASDTLTKSDLDKIIAYVAGQSSSNFFRTRKKRQNIRILIAEVTEIRILQNERS